MKKNKKIYKFWVIASTTLVLIYFIWGYFGFAGAWIPGRYDLKNKNYEVFWGLADKLPSTNGTCRIYLYTPFKRQGLIDTSGKVIIPFKYQFIDFAQFEARLIPAENLNGKYGLLNKENKIVQQFIYTSKLISPKYAGTTGYLNYFISEINGKKTMIDSLGNVIIPAEYSDIFMPFQNKFFYAIASKGIFSNIVFPDGKIVKKEYLITDATYPNQSNHLIVHGVKTTDLNQKLWDIKSLNTSIQANNETEYLVSINNSKPIKQWFAIYDGKGKEVLPMEYDDIDWLAKGINSEELKVLRVRKNGKWGLYSVNQNKWLLQIKYQDIKNGVNEKLPLIKVKKHLTGSYNYFDLDGNLILSDKATVLYENKDLGQLFFSKNSKNYKMIFDKEKQKFIWYKQ